ncbi:hypothetical protein [Neisseria sp. Ec49-e6-T10]|uniref:hypothetical protein n=1 Tax=Neisseria sp. Ec49-e6-T10 TaxID=3140744 RepID=UPI003EBD61C3
MVVLNAIPNVKNLQFGNVLKHRVNGWQAIYICQTQEPVKNLAYYLYGLIPGVVPKEENRYWLVSFDGDQQFSFTEKELAQQFAFRGQTLSSNELSDRFKVHEENLNCVSVYS